MRMLIAGLFAAFVAFAVPAFAQVPLPTMADVNAAVAADAARPQGTPSALASEVAQILADNPALAPAVADLAATLPPAQRGALVQAFALASEALSGNPTAQAQLNAVAQAAFGEAYASAQAAVASAGPAASDVGFGGATGLVSPGTSGIGGGGGGGGGAANPDCPRGQVSPNCPV